MIPIHIDPVKAMEAARNARLVAIDTETTGVRTRLDQIVGISLAVEDAVFYIPIQHIAPGSRNFPIDSFRSAWLEIFVPGGPTVAMHNASFDLNMLRNEGLPVRCPVVDTMLAAHFLDENRHFHGKSYKLKELSLDLRNFKQPTFDETTGGGSIAIVPVRKAAFYAGADAWATFQLWKRLKEDLERAGRWSAFERLELGLIPLTAGMIFNGVKVDQDYLKRFGQEKTALLNAKQAEVDRMAGRRVRLGSGPDLIKLLYKELRLPVQRRGKTPAPTVDKHALEKIQDAHPIIDPIQKAREAHQLISKVSRGLPEHVNPRTSRIHPNIQRMTDTGRFFCRAPNLQGLAKGKGVRCAVVPEPGNVLVIADFSQIELRVMAHYSQDPTFLKFFREGLDLHLETAQTVLELSPDADEETIKEFRSRAKRLNFAMIYGAGPSRISQVLKQSRGDAKKTLLAFFAKYPGVKRFIDETHEKIRMTGELTSIFGRLRRIPGLYEMAQLGSISLRYGAHEHDGTFDGEIITPLEFCISVELVEAFDETLGKLVLSRRLGRLQVDRSSPFMADKDKVAKIPRKNFAYSHLREVVIDGKPIKLMPVNEAQRVGLNALIQSTGSDICKLAMLRADQVARQHGAFLILEVHDELVYECPKATSRVFRKALKKTIEEQPDQGFMVPIEASVKRRLRYERAK